MLDFVVREKMDPEAKTPKKKKNQVRTGIILTKTYGGIKIARDYIGVYLVLFYLLSRRERHVYSSATPRDRPIGFRRSRIKSGRRVRICVSLFCDNYDTLVPCTHAVCYLNVRSSFYTMIAL